MYQEVVIYLRHVGPKDQLRVNFLIYNIMTGEIFLLQWILNLLPYISSFSKSLKLILKFLKLTVRIDQYIPLDEDDLKVF